MNPTPYNTILNKNGNIELIQNHQIKYSSSPVIKQLAYIHSGIRIGTSIVKKEKPIPGEENVIINQIHRQRFNPNQGYVITGGHFSQLYVRNLGIFYNAILDPRIPASEEDWIHRQQITLQTLALDLEIFRQAKKCFTTIVPLRQYNYTGINIYTYPSDSLFAIMYTLCALLDSTFLSQLFPAVTQQAAQTNQLQTRQAAEKLLKTYKQDLARLLLDYKTHTLDHNTHLIKKNIHLASARDGIKRQSSFYDNVILWATFRLADTLDIIKTEANQLSNWKQTIIDNFWDSREGLFIDDLSTECQKEKTFSADSFIITSTEFLDRKNKVEKQMLLRMIDYVKKNNYDLPFPLQYSLQNTPKKLYPAVRYFATSYMGESIWSHWGMEYIKTLILLSKDEPDLLKDAKRHLESYKRNIEEYGGYPELYDTNGKLLKQRLYKSVLHNGWVINYEQTKMLFTANI